MRTVLMACLIVGWLAGLAQAVDIQYRLATLDVITASDAPISSAEGYGIATITGVTAESIVWPGPTGSPSAAACQGKPEWSRMTDPNGTTIAALGLVVQPGPLFFQTSSTLLVGCYEVSSWRQLRTLYRDALRQGFLSNNKEFLDVINDIETWVLRRCPGTAGGANCDTARANALTLDSEYPGSGVTAAFTTDAVQLQSDVYTFKNAQCTANPGGPFC